MKHLFQSSWKFGVGAGISLAYSEITMEKGT